MSYETVIGLEVHVQLNTNSKLFCACSTEFGAEPNTQTCPICQGHPGALPVFNKEVLYKAVQAGLSTDCSISKFSKFDRKNYFYPDLPKAYQISQFDLPICKNGKIEIIFENGDKKTIGINRIHIEEDAGKLIHSDVKGVNESYVDLNRCGVPLLEIVSEADMRSPEEAYLYLTTLKQILQYIEISDCDMEKGSLRCDANVSLRPIGQKEFGIKAEIKNMNSFHGVKKALEYEVRRQSKVLDKGEAVIQETRLYDADKDITLSMRSKEEAHDYRYFPDPDLVPIIVEDEYIKSIKNQLPELPQAKKNRFISDLGLPEYDAGVLTSDKYLSIYYEETLKSYSKDPKKISNWIMSEVLKYLNEQNITADKFIVKPEQVAQLFILQDEGTISGKIAKTVFEKMVNTGKAAEVIVEEEGLKQVSDTGELEKIIDTVLNDNTAQVEQYKSGNEKVFGFFMGQIMKATKGKANPKLVTELLRKKLTE